MPGGYNYAREISWAFSPYIFIHTKTHVAVHDWDFPSTQKQWIRWPKLSLPADVLWGSFVTHSFLLFPFGVRFTHINSPWLADHDTITNRILAYSNNPERKCRLFLADVIQTQGQSVELGEKARRKFSSTGERAPGYRLSPDHFQTVKWMLAPDWAQKMLCIIVPNRGTASPEFFSWVRTRRDSYWLDHGLSGAPNKCTQSGNFQFDVNTLFQNTGCLYTRLLSKT